MNTEARDGRGSRHWSLKWMNLRPPPAQKLPWTAMCGPAERHGHRHRQDGTMSVDPRVADLLASPKARWALAWLAATPADESAPADAFNAADTRPRHSRLHQLRHNPAGLLAEIHTHVDDWRYNRAGRRGVDRLGPVDGYARLAAYLLTTPAADWWYQPLNLTSQTWICDDPDITHGHRLPFSTNFGHHWDATGPAVAPATSTRLPNLPATVLLADHDLAPHQRPKPGTLSAWRAQLKPDVRVYEIQGAVDWVNLVAQYPSHRTDLCLAPDLMSRWRPKELVWTPDWRAVAQDYDGVHMSVPGWLTATSQILDLPDRDGHTICEGWPAESTTWFRPVFSGPFERLDTGPLGYGYGRPTAGADHDLTTPVLPAGPWWRRLLRPFGAKDIAFL